MGVYLFKRSESGNTKMERVGTDGDFTTPEVPPDVEVESGPTITLHRCTVEDCNKDFPIVALVAKHFNKDHIDLFEDKNSWRQYYREVSA